MRFISLVVAALALTSCSLIDTGSTTTAVDAANLPPLTSREQALIFGADGAMQQQNYAAAERDYLSAVAESKGRVEAHLALARLYDKQHLPQKERAILERALTLQPKHPLANYMLGKLYLNTNSYNDALAAFQRGRVLAPDDIDLTIGEAVTQDMLGKHVAAQSLYLRLLNNNPQAKLTIVRTNLAMSYLLSNQPQKAVDLLKAEVDRPDASPVSRHNLALAYGLLGRNGDAKAVLHGDLDEESRLLTVARMRAYHRERMGNEMAAPPQPVISEVAEPVEPPFAAPVQVIQKEPTVVKPVVVPPAVPKPVVAAKPAVKKAAPAQSADTDLVPVIVDPTPVTTAPKVVAPKVVEPKPDATDTLENDPNYIPGLTDDEDDIDAAVKKD